jgi:hypothetical protein
MESTGKRDEIQISQKTADLLAAAGKSSWVSPREELVLAKGKGELSTFWLATTVGASDETRSIARTDTCSTDDTPTNDKILPDAPLSKDERLIKWNVENLLSDLVQVQKLRTLGSQDAPKTSGPIKAVRTKPTPIEEVTDFIPLVSSLQKIALSADKTGTTSLDPRVETQLTEYLTGIACMHRNNPAHNFYLASHVALAAQKLLSCLAHVNPLVAFAVVFSALVQAVDHTGFTNEQLVSENPKLAAYYQVGVSEQNSIDLAWDLLMDEKFSILRQAIYQTDQEASLFRRLVVTLVLATDIADPGLRRRRQERWEQAFSSLNIDNKDDRQYTLALECLMQVSTSAHTMQHWHIYLKWNKLYFQEQHQAHQRGSGIESPEETWYNSELELFDGTIIPLAQKLTECNVFDDSSQEYLHYALNNRKNWAEQGRELVQEYQESSTVQSTRTP